MTGTDWRAYERYYTRLTYPDVPSVIMFMFEPGYAVYNYIFAKLGINFWHFFIFTKLVAFIIVMKTIQYYSPHRTFFLTLLFFIAFYAFFLFIDNPMRNLIAISIFLCSLKSLQERKIVKYIGWTILAMLFHTSAIIMLIFYYFGNKSYKTFIIILCYIILNLIFSSRTFIFDIGKHLFSFWPSVYSRIVRYSNNQNINFGGGKLISLGFLVHNVFFILILIFRNRIENVNHGKLIFMFSILWLIFFRIGLTVTVMSRFGLYLAVFYAVSIGVIINGFIRDMKWMYSLCVFIICILSCVSYLIKDFRYIPYTNYIMYLDTDLSYEKRDEYNKEYTPYKN